jgi:hypothetical protein
MITMGLETETLVFATGLFAAMQVMLGLGLRLGARYRARAGEGAGAGIGAVEAAVYGLLGLLIAFTFQGAASRFDIRRQLITEEANAIGTAWLRIDLMPAARQSAMRDSFRDYLDSRLETYHKIPDMAAVDTEMAHSAQLQNEIWAQAIAAEAESGMKIVGGLLPALNAMFDIATSRTMAAKTHPPGILFVMLAFLACASALLAGHAMSGSRARSWIHIVAYALVLAVTVFVILDMEYPRLGLIRVDTFDQVLVDLRQSME